MFLLVTTLIKFVIVILLFVMPLASLLTWMERRQSAYSQDRVGPYKAHIKVGRFKIALAGLLHIAADGLKMFFKEPFAPAGADKTIFHVAPLIGFVVAVVTMALVPFGPDLMTADIPYITSILSAETIRENPVIPLQIARLDSGLLWIFAITSLGVYSVALAGWASNNRFALLGGLRASAQAISYEIALGLTVVGVLIAFGSTELFAIAQAQNQMVLGALPAWGIFIQPMAAMLFLAAAIAETKRGPFDLPEGESEIIGYFIEYSSMSFGLFMLSEFVEIVVLACVFTTLFLGGSELPWILGESSVYLGFTTIEVSSFGHAIAGMVVFGLKVFLLSAFQLQIRWTLPRFRYDQLMNLGWKSLLPLALANIFVTAGLVWLDPSLTVLTYFGLGTIAVFFMVVIAGPRRLHGGSAGHGHGHGTSAGHDSGHGDSHGVVVASPHHAPSASPDAAHGHAAARSTVAAH